MRRPGQLVRVKLIDASTPGAIDPIRSSVDLARKRWKNEAKNKKSIFLSPSWVILFPICDDRRGLVYLSHPLFSIASCLRRVPSNQAKMPLALGWLRSFRSSKIDLRRFTLCVAPWKRHVVNNIRLKKKGACVGAWVVDLHACMRLLCVSVKRANARPQVGDRKAAKERPKQSCWTLSSRQTQPSYRQQVDIGFPSSSTWPDFSRCVSYSLVIIITFISAHRPHNDHSKNKRRTRWFFLSLSLFLFFVFLFRFIWWNVFSMTSPIVVLTPSSCCDVYLSNRHKLFNGLARINKAASTSCLFFDDSSKSQDISFLPSSWLTIFVELNKSSDRHRRRDR